MHRGAPIPSRSTKAPRALTGRRPPIAGDAARRRRGLGQSLAEFAILLPLLLILIVGIADFGRLFTAGIVMEAAARNAAEVAAHEYLNGPPGPLTAPPAPPPGYYDELHLKAARVVCAEARVLPNTTYANGSCAEMPLVLVCAHDGADDACGSEPFAAVIPPECGSLSTPPVSEMPVGAEPSRHVEVRVCYRFSTLIRLPFLTLGDIWLERSRDFTVADY